MHMQTLSTCVSIYEHVQPNGKRDEIQAFWMFMQLFILPLCVILGGARAVRECPILVLKRKCKYLIS